MDRRKRAIDAYTRFRDADSPTESNEHPSEPENATESAKAEKPAKAGEPGFEKTTTRTTGSMDPSRLASLLEGAGSTRAARLLLALGTDHAAEVMRLLDPDEVEAVTAAIMETESVPRRELEDLLAEMPSERRDGPVRGGPDVARAMLVAAFGQEEGERHFFRSVPNAPAHHFAFLNGLEPAQLHAAIKGESPAAAALLIAHVERPLAAHVLSLLPADQGAEVARRIARMGKLSRDVVVRVEEAIREKIRRQGRQVTQGLDGPATLASILRHMGPAAGEAILGQLRDADLDLGESIRKKLYTTDLLFAVSDRHLADLLREFSDREIALFLKGKDEELRARVLRGISERRARSISEEYAHLGGQLRAEVDEVTSQVLDRMRALEEDGSILVPREGDHYI